MRSVNKNSNQKFTLDLTGKGAELYRKAETGDAEAQYDYAWYLLHDEHAAQREGLTEETVAWAIKYWKRASMAGARGGGAAMQIAELYYQGKLVPQDYKEARKWYQTATLKNNPVALCALGDYAYYGHDGRIDYAQAVRYYLQAAPEFIDAFYRLGDLFAKGQFFLEDRELAREIYQYVLDKEDKFAKKLGYHSDAYTKAKERMEALGQRDAVAAPDYASETEEQQALRLAVLAKIRKETKAEGTK